MAAVMREFLPGLPDPLGDSWSTDIRPGYANRSISSVDELVSIREIGCLDAPFRLPAGSTIKDCMAHFEWAIQRSAWRGGY